MTASVAGDAAPADGRPRAPRLPVVLVAVLGAASAYALAQPAPASPGAQRVLAPENLLGAFDALVLLLLVRPGRRDAAETLALAAVASPFHAALAAAAGAGAGLHAAIGLAAAAWGAAAVVAARRAPRVGAAGAAAAAFALPLAAYGLADFARLPVAAAFLASPLTAPVVLARRATTAAAGDAVPALVGAAVLLAAATLLPRKPRAEPSS